MTFFYCTLQILDLPVFQSVPFEHSLDIGDGSSLVGRVQFSLDRQGSATLVVISKDTVDRFRTARISVKLN